MFSNKLLSPTYLLSVLLIASTLLPMRSCEQPAGTVGFFVSPNAPDVLVPAFHTAETIAQSRLAEPAWGFIHLPLMLVTLFGFYFAYLTFVPIAMAAVLLNFNPFVLRRLYQRTVLILFAMVTYTVWASIVHPLQYIKLVVVLFGFLIASLHTSQGRDLWHDLMPTVFCPQYKLGVLSSTAYAHSYLCFLSAVYLAGWGSSLLLGGMIAAAINVLMAVALIVIAKQCTEDSHAYPRFGIREMMVVTTFAALLFGFHGFMIKEGGQLEQRIIRESGVIYP